MRVRTTAPETADIDFLSLQRLEDLAQLEQYVSACDEISGHLRELDRLIPIATERYRALWTGFQGASLAFKGQEAEAPEVTEARGEIQDLQDQRRVLLDNAGIVRAELETAKAELRGQLLPAMRSQLGTPLDALIAGLQSVAAIERLCGALPGQNQAQIRQVMTAILGYLVGVRAQLEEGN